MTSLKFEVTMLYVSKASTSKIDAKKLLVIFSSQNELTELCMI